MDLKQRMGALTGEEKERYEQQFVPKLLKPEEADTIKEEEKESPMSLYTNYLLWVLVGLAVTAVLIIFLWQYDKRYKKKIAAKQAATDVTKNDVSDRKEE